MSSNQFDPKNLPTKDFFGEQRAPFQPSQGRIVEPSTHPAIPAHSPVVRDVTPPKPYANVQERKR